MNSNPHSDILKAEIPHESGKKLSFLEELKGRAKGAFQVKDLLNAEMLYSKAIDVGETIEGRSTGDYLLYSNRAAVRLLLTKNDGALGDCEKCLSLEPDFIKAHFRKAQALQRLSKFERAASACNAGLEKHAGNAELTNLLKTINEECEKDKVEKAKFNAEAREARPDLPKPEPTRIQMDPKNKKLEAERAGGDSLDSPSGMRGYKKTADGKTTSYFHTDITEEAKALIGDCKPQKIDVPVETEKNAMGSAWNQAGTFEETSMTRWFHDKLRSSFPLPTIVALPNAAPSIELEVDNIEGDASITCARGKVKHIHDCAVTFKWKFKTDDGCEGLGTIKFESDGDGDLDVLVDVDQKTHSQTRSLVNEYVKSSAKGVQPFVMEKFKAIQTEFGQIKKQ